MEFYIKKGKPLLFAHFSHGKVQKNIMLSNKCDNKNFPSVFSSERLNYILDILLLIQGTGNTMVMFKIPDKI